MKSAIFAVCVFACAYATSLDQEASVVKYESEQHADKTYSFNLETSNGIFSQAESKVKPVGKDEVAFGVQGSDRYTAPDGKVIETRYVADENGFRAEGAHLPTPPAPEPIPEYILKAIDYIKAHSTTEKNL